MACPYFVPARRLEFTGWARPPRLPLGDPWAGTCHARADETFEPLESQQREVCNCGYARGRCDRFPADAAADAVRFSMREDAGDRLRVVFVLEKEHAPVEHGVLEYTIEGARVSGDPVSGALDPQARAFVESYLRRMLGGRDLSRVEL